MKFNIHYTFTSSKGFTYTGIVKFKAKNSDAARYYFQKQNRDFVINKIEEVSHGK